jgi:hypothetical protein
MGEIVDLRGRQPVPTPASVLADPSGRRARRLAHAGRAMVGVFVVWLAGLALAGIGILPAGDVPLGPPLVSQSPPRLTRLPKPHPPTRSDLFPALPSASVVSSATARTQSTTALTRPGSPSASTRLTSTSDTAAQRSPAPRGHLNGGPGGGKSIPPATRTPVRAPAPGSAGHGATASSGATGSGAVGPAGATSTSSAARAGKVNGTSTAPGQTTRQTAPGHTKTATTGSSAGAPGQVKQTTTPTTTTSPGQSGSAPGQTITHGNGRGNN